MQRAHPILTSLSLPPTPKETPPTLCICRAENYPPENPRGFTRKEKVFVKLFNKKNFSVMVISEVKKGNKKVEVATVNFSTKTKGLQWNVEKETSEISLADANPESKTTKNGDPYLRFTIDGVTFAQFEANFVMAYVKAMELNPSEGDEIEIPTDTIFKLTPNGAEFKKN